MGSRKDDLSKLELLSGLRSGHTGSDAGSFTKGSFGHEGIETMAQTVTAEEDDETGDGVAKELPSAVRQHLGVQLRKVYGEMVNEPLPDKFTKLLEELAGKEE